MMYYRERIRKQPRRKELEDTQKNRKKIGAAGSNLQTTGPAEKLR
jgi:hypothetical protein